MSDVIEARRRALEAVLLTSTAKDEQHLDDEFWQKIIHLAWAGKSLQDRRHHRQQIRNLLDDALRRKQGMTE